MHTFGSFPYAAVARAGLDIQLATSSSDWHGHVHEQQVNVLQAAACPLLMVTLFLSEHEQHVQPAAITLTDTNQTICGWTAT